MTKKIWMLIGLAVVLAGFSIYVNRDFFAKDSIRIYHRSRPARLFSTSTSKRRPDTSLVDPLMFGFTRQLALKSVQVIPVSDAETNRFPHAIWHLLSDSNSVPLRDFYYGSPIRGMRPSVKGALPEPLQPNVKYRLLVESESFKGEYDFTPVARR